jgi:hypothetical protein
MVPLSGRSHLAGRYLSVFDLVLAVNFLDVFGSLRMPLDLVFITVINSPPYYFKHIISSLSWVYVKILLNQDYYLYNFV